MSLGKTGSIVEIFDDIQRETWRDLLHGDRAFGGRSFSFAQSGKVGKVLAAAFLAEHRSLYRRQISRYLVGDEKSIWHMLYWAIYVSDKRAQKKKSWSRSSVNNLE